jgi:hypothetical protein
MIRAALIAHLLIACDGPVCAPDAMASALAGARPGDVVLVGDCEIAGAFTVPAGVTLRGTSDASSLSSIDAPNAAVLDVTGDGARIERLRVRADHGYYAIRAAGVGDLAIQDTEVTVARGLGVLLRDGSFALVSVSIEGPVDPASVGLDPPTDPELTGSLGLAIERSTVAIDGLYVRGFAVAGVVVQDGELTWTDGDEEPDVEGMLGYGVAIFGSTATLDGVGVSGMLSAPGMPGFALVAGATTALDARAVHITDGEGYGIYADDSELELADVVIERVVLVGIQAQGGSLHATDVTLRDDGGAGLAALDVREISLQRVVASGVRAQLIAGDTEDVTIGDGVHVRRTGASAPPIDLVADILEVRDNTRVGLLIDGADTAPARLELTGVQALSSGEALGAVTQRTMIGPEWDDDITRSGAAEANDAIFGGVIDPVGLLMPPIIPAVMP